jgi:transcriptional regulator with GAF, ATPase, and Fis domain
VGAFEKLGARDWRSDEPRFERIIGNSQALESVLEQVERVAPTQGEVYVPEVESGVPESRV